MFGWLGGWLFGVWWCRSLFVCLKLWCCVFCVGGWLLIVRLSGIARRLIDCLVPLLC